MSSVMDRSPDSQARRDAQLIKLWPTGSLCAVIAEKLGYNHASSVAHAARRLGLTPRRCKTGQGINAKRDAARRTERARGEARMLANLERAELKPVGPFPTMWRCEICGGRSSTPIHASHGVAA
jgi:hypothetical protein